MTDAGWPIAWVQDGDVALGLTDIQADTELEPLAMILDEGDQGSRDLQPVRCKVG
jgi:hypothetical protein